MVTMTHDLYLCPKQLVWTLVKPVFFEHLRYAHDMRSKADAFRHRLLLITVFQCWKIVVLLEMPPPLVESSDDSHYADYIADEDDTYSDSSADSVNVFRNNAGIHSLPEAIIFLSSAVRMRSNTTASS